MDLKDYILHIPTGNLHAVTQDDPIRKRPDMREPTLDEFNAWFGILPPEEAPTIDDSELDARTKAFLRGDSVPVASSRGKPRGRPPVRRPIK